MGPATGFAEVYTPGGDIPACGDVFRQPRLSATLEQIGRAGTEDFYRGDLARAIAADLERVGSPVHGSDLASHQAKAVTPLSLRVGDATVYNMRPPTQGLASLLILGAFEKMDCAEADGFDFVHLLVEASKQAFAIRDRHITDEAFMSAPPESFLTEAVVAELAAGIDPGRPRPGSAGAPTAIPSGWA